MEGKMIHRERNRFEEPNCNPEEEEREQGLRNQLKKLELAARYGADFSEEPSGIPAQVEAQWLQYIEEFERHIQVAKKTTVREFIGNPPVTEARDISPEEVGVHVKHLLDLMESNGVVVNFLCPVPDSEIYRFLTEELLDHEMDDFRIPGMSLHYIYEEFHPNDEYDVKMWSEHFLSGLFWLESDLISHLIANNGVMDADSMPVTSEQFKKDIECFRGSFASFEHPDLDVLSCTVNEDTAAVTLSITWRGVLDEGTPTVTRKGTSTVRLHKGEFGSWEIVQVIVPGWNGPQGG
jgi:hypothetical protein